MLNQSREMFNNYIENQESFDDVRKSVIRCVYNNMAIWEKVKRKDVLEMDKMDLLDLCNRKFAKRSYGSLKTRVVAINDILNWLDIDYRLSMSDFNEDTFSKDTDRYYTIEEIKDICDLFINPQDKVIVYCTFMGAYGIGHKDLLNLKEKDIDFENKLLKLENNWIIIDDYLEDILRDTLDPVWGGTYYKYIVDEGKKGTCSDSYELNMRCEYVLKPKPYSKNNQGLDKMKTSGIQRRLKKLSEYSETTLNAIDIYRSGLMHKMYLKEQETGQSWTVEAIQRWLKDNNYKSQPYELLRLYKDKYKINQRQSMN